MGKSSTVNSILGERVAAVSAFQVCNYNIISYDNGLATLLVDAHFHGGIY